MKKAKLAKISDFYRKNSGLLQKLNLILPRITGSKHLCFADLQRTSIMVNRCPVSKENEKERFLSGRRMVQML